MINTNFKHRLWADTETRSRNDIKRGAYVYGEDSSLLLYMYALDEGPVNLWSPLEGQPMPRDLHEYLLSPEVELAFHNVDFDRTQMLAWGWGNHYDLTPYRFYCTMTHARMCALPGSLDQLCKALGLPVEYAKREGDALIRMFCIPRKGRPAHDPFVQPWENPAAWDMFKTYGVMDVVSMREAMRYVPQIYSPVTREFFARTSAMNDRGVGIDRDLVHAAMTQAETLKRFYKEEGKRLTDNYRMERKDGTLVKEFNIQSQQALLAYFKEYNIVLPDARVNTIEKFLSTEQALYLPPTMKHLLTTRLEANKSSVTKYKAIHTGTNADGRARGLISYYGAGRTGRDAGRRVQPQNLARPAIVGVKKGADKKVIWDMDRAADVVKRGLTELTFDQPMQILSDCVRGTLVPAPGHRFAVADLSNIEGRGLPWLAGETWKLQYFRDYDAGLVKYDNYEVAYAKAFNIDPSTVDKIMRSHGKVIELACGYGGGVGGFMAFAAVYRIDLKDIGDAILATAPHDEYYDVQRSFEWYKSKGLTYGLGLHEWTGCMFLVKAWRKAHPETVALWKRCQVAFVAAIRNPGVQFPMATGTYAININGWVFVYLPSGRPLVYPMAAVEGEGYNQTVTFMGVNSFTKQWGLNFTMGSRLAENITQAFAADCLFWNIPAIENAGYPIVLRVHDELVTEPIDDGYHTGGRLAQMMSQTQYWCPDLPLAAVGEDLTRYQK